MEILFPKWGPCLKDDEYKLEQKDLLKEAIVIAHNDFLLQLPERDRKRVEIYSGFGLFRIRYLPRTYLMLHYMIPFPCDLDFRCSMLECRVCLQTSDVFGHHYLNCNMIGKITLHNSSEMRYIVRYGAEDWG